MARPQVFGPYQLVDRIGVGAMGEVYRAVARRDGRVVAVKRLTAYASADADAVAMLQSEAALGKILDHPAIPKISDVGQIDGVHYVAYDYVPGRDLRAIQDRALRKGLAPPSVTGRRSVPDTERPEPVPLDVAVHVVLRVAEALAHAHVCKDGQGKPLRLVHRDVSPTNVIVSFDGEVKLLDFGIARSDGRLVRTDASQIKGTVGYMSPEQFRGEAIDGRSDLYSLAVCLWELCTARRLIEPSLPPGAAERILAGEIPPPRSVADRLGSASAGAADRLGAASPGTPGASAGTRLSVEMEQVLLKALAPSREERYATVTEFHDALTRQAAAEGLLADSGRVSRYVRKLFPEAAAEEAASRQESPDMADNKGGSDLDVFEGLAKKASRPTAPGLTPPPPAAPRKSTLLGGLGPLPPPVAPPGVKPPDGAATKPAIQDAGPAIKADGLPKPGLPPPAPPPSKLPTLPPVAPPPAKSGTLPGLSGPPMPLPPPSRLPPPSAAAPPPMPVASAPAGMPPLPPVAPPRGSAPPPAAASSLPPVAPPPPKPPTAPPAPFLPAPSVADAKPPPPLPPPAPLAPLPGAAAKPLPPPVAPPKEKPGKAAVDMDWDDEEESTHVYDKADGEMPMPARPAKVGAAAALLASSGGTARSAAPPPQANALPSVPPPPPPVPAVPNEPPAPLLRRDEPTAVRPRPVLPSHPQAGGGTSKLAVLLGGAALVVALIVLAVTLMPKKGAIKINVAAKNGAPVGAVDVYIDGQKRCEATPCVLSELDIGEKTIKVIAPGYLPAESRETIEASKEKVITVPIEPSGAGTGAVAVSGGGLTQTPSAPTSTGGGPVLKIGGTDAEKGVHVLVDGADKGTLPAEIKDLSPGSHKVRFEGDRYEKLEQTVDLTAGQVKDLGDIKLKVVKGQVTLDIVTQGVAITLVRRGDKKIEKKLTDSMLKNAPVRLDIDTSENWRLVATKKSFDDFAQDLTFEDGQAEKTVKIELFEIGKPPPPVVAVGPNTGPREPPTPKEPKEPKDSGGSGTGTLNINSIPVSKVVLDGKPLGSTPKVGVSVPAGSHTVTFIHPDLGKQSVTVQVKNGETKTAAVRFKQE